MGNTCLDRNGMREHLSVQVIGDSTLPPLLLLHGFLSSNLQWALNEGALSKHFQLFKVELWGHGNSPVPKEEAAYSVGEYLLQIENIRERFAIKKWSLIGQSFGAGIVLHYAQKHPQHCTAILTTNSMSAFSKSYSENQQCHAERMLAYQSALATKGVRGLPMHPVHATRINSDLKGKMVVLADALVDSVVLGHFSMLNELTINTDLMPRSCASFLLNGVFEKKFQAVVASLQLCWPELVINTLSGGHSVNLDCSKEFDRQVISCLGIPVSR